MKTLDGLIDTQALGKMAPLVVGLLTGLSELRDRSYRSVPESPLSTAGGRVGTSGGDLRPTPRRSPWCFVCGRKASLIGRSGADGSRSGDHHPNRQRKGGDVVLKMLVGVGLGFLLFTNPEARQITAGLLRSTANAIAPEQDGKTF